VDDAPDGPTTLVALGAANTLGMTLAGVGLIVAVRRAAGRAALSGVARTVVVLVVVGTVAAVVGRRVTDAAADGLGSGVPAALGSGAAGAVLAAVLVGVGVGMLDRGAVRDLRSAEGAAGAAEVTRNDRRVDDRSSHHGPSAPGPTEVDHV
jgi:putative peptidoglycan lipid II flippase